METAKVQNNKVSAKPLVQQYRAIISQIGRDAFENARVHNNKMSAANMDFSREISKSIADNTYQATFKYNAFKHINAPINNILVPTFFSSIVNNVMTLHCDF